MIAAGPRRPRGRKRTLTFVALALLLVIVAGVYMVGHTHGSGATQEGGREPAVRVVQLSKAPEQHSDSGNNTGIPMKPQTLHIYAHSAGVLDEVARWGMITSCMHASAAWRVQKVQAKRGMSGEEL